MDNLKRVMVSLPESLLDEVDWLVQQENGNRSQFIREAMRLYLADLRRRELREKMKRGYSEMADFNLQVTQDHNCRDELRILEKYEQGLVDSDGSRGS